MWRGGRNGGGWERCLGGGCRCGSGGGRVCPEDGGAVGGEVAALGGREGETETEGGIDPQEPGPFGREGRGEEDGAVVGKGNPAPIEEKVEIRNQGEAVGGIEALGIGGNGPGFCVGSAEEGGIVETGDGTGVAPEGEEFLPVAPLAVAGEDKLGAVGGVVGHDRRRREGGRRGTAGGQVGQNFEYGGKKGKEGVALGSVDGELEGGAVKGPAREGGGKVVGGGWFEGEEEGGGPVEVEVEGAGMAVVGEAERRADGAARASLGRGTVGPAGAVGDGLEDGEGEHGGFQGLTRVLQWDG